MQFEEWHVPLGPKVRGTQALYSVLRQNASSIQQLDFVLLTSSFVTAVGNVAQGNYCAANAFLDAMAGHMRAQAGIPATSLMVGIIQGIGGASGREDIMRHFSRTAAYEVFEGEFLQHVENAIGFAPSSAGGGVSGGYLTRAQILTGLDPDMKFTMHDDARARLDADPRFGIFLKNVDEVAAGHASAKGGAGGHAAQNGGLSLMEALQSRLSDLLVVPPEGLAVDKPVVDLGLDSLAGAAFVKWLQNEYGVHVSFATLGAEALSIARLVERMDVEKA